MKRSRLGPGREFDLIRRMLAPEGTSSGEVTAGPGDDCAVLSDGGLVLSCDLTVEGTHFRREWLSLEEIGYRAAAAALSDLAAMGAKPVGMLVSMGLPEGDPEVTGPALHTGISEACEGVGTEIIGGDLSSSGAGIVLDIVVVGRASNPVYRSGGRPGDEIWVTGVLGGSGGAVHAWNQGTEPSDSLRRAFARPTPRILESEWLIERSEVHAMIDLSDGLLGDAGHLASAGGVRLVLEKDRVPVHPGLESHLGGPGEAQKMALSAGEDYELCVLVASGSIGAELRRVFRERFGVGLTRVGWVEDGAGVFLSTGGGLPLQPVTESGFSHFEGDGT